MNRELDPPRVTVVVPVYNVERYLEECLESLASQTFKNFECIVVDDGSTDSSADKARAFAARDTRFRVVSQPNAGLGAARNAGIEAANPLSEYLTFLDSDDTIPEGAYELLVETADANKSDIVSGNVRTFTSKGSEQSPMHANIMRSTRLSTHISRDRILFYDRLAPNKLFRFSFWRENGFRFPEGVLYEDSAVILRAHFAAERVAVLDTSVYNWRQREAGEPQSITQRRMEPGAVRDRVHAVDQFSRFLAERIAEEPGFRAHKAYYDKIGLTSEINIFLKLLPRGDALFQAQFMESAGGFVSRVDPETLQQLPALARLKWYLVGRGLLPELLHVLAYEAKGEVMPVVRGLRHRYAGYPYFGDKALKVPKSIYVVDDELKLKTRVDSAVWRDGKLVIAGFSHLEFVNVHEKRMSRKVLALRRGRSRRIVPLTTHTTYRPDVTASSSQPRYCYDWSGFEAVLDPERLKTAGEWVEGTWRAALVVFSRGLTRKGLANAEPLKDGRQPRPLYLDDDLCILPLVGAKALEIKIEKVRAWFDSITVADDRLCFRGRLRAELGLAGSLLLRRGKGGLELRDLLMLGPVEEGVEWREFSASVAVADLFGRLGLDANDRGEHGDGWSVHLESGDGRTLLRARLRSGVAGDCVPVPARLAPTVRPWEIAPFRTNADELNVHVRTLRPILDGASVGADGAIELRGAYAAATDEPMELVLSIRGHVEEQRFPLTRDGVRFEARLNPAAIRSLAGVLPLPSGTWDVKLRPIGSVQAGLQLKVAEGLRDNGMPTPVVVTGRTYDLKISGSDHLALRIASDLSLEETGQYSQYRLRKRVYERARLEPLLETVLYDSYTGKQYSDSPRAVHERLLELEAPVEHLWVVRDSQVELPPTAKRVRMWSEEWFEAMARSRYIVTNAHLPYWIRRREDQVVVQAWHGTPLKKIGHDIENVQFSDGYLNRVAQESKSWSFIISPNRFSTPILKRAFDYKGEMLESGYPRNDVLYAADRDERAAAIRAELGIPQGRKVVLYAPTWRDDQFYAPGRFKLDLRIDLEQARERLGEDFALLIRRHPNIVDEVPDAGNGFVWDVSKYPDVGELMLAADVLITDYSSLMFDYAHLRRPMLFFTYDLDHYRHNLRGFYFDFEEQAPGPLLRTSAELVDSLSRIDEVELGYAARAERFREQFCDLDDGRAALRVIARMGELAGRPLVARHLLDAALQPSVPSQASTPTDRPSTPISV